MSEPIYNDDVRDLEPVHEQAGEAAIGRWTWRLVLFLRVMAGVSMLKGLYHWSRMCGIGVGESELFTYQSVAWQVATVFFAVIDLVAAVGLWLAAAWGAVIWLMSIASMLAVEIFFPQVFGAGLLTGMVEGTLRAIYLLLALKSAQEHPQG
jgi:fatty acid desaturase